MEPARINIAIEKDIIPEKKKYLPLQYKRNITRSTILLGGRIFFENHLEERLSDQA